MVPCGIETEYLNVGHVRKPCQRMPVCRMEGTEGPDEIIKRYATNHIDVIGDVFGIIVDSEIVIDYLIKYDKCS